MNILVFGASGATGRLYAQQALATGHRVSAFVRDAAAALPGKVRVVPGDATDPDAVGAAIAGQDVVVSTLGVRNSMRSGRLIERSTDTDQWLRKHVIVASG